MPIKYCYSVNHGYGGIEDEVTLCYATYPFPAQVPLNSKVPSHALGCVRERGRLEGSLRVGRLSLPLLAQLNQYFFCFLLVSPVYSGPAGLVLHRGFPAGHSRRHAAPALALPGHEGAEGVLAVLVVGAVPVLRVGVLGELVGCGKLIMKLLFVEENLVVCKKISLRPWTAISLGLSANFSAPFWTSTW